MTAYDANGVIVDQHELSFTSPGVISPTSSDLYGNLHLTGDAITASPGQPGNWTWNVSGTGIVEAVLEFGRGFDPYIGFDTLSFTTECSVCQPSLSTADFSQVAVGGSVEGLGAVAPNLKIDAVGTAVKILPATEFFAYRAPNGAAAVSNDGVAAGGGFSDIATATAHQAHLYTFTFPGISVSNFSLHMLDYGDLNTSLDTFHDVIMTAYDANGVIVDQHELSFTSPGVISPTSSDLYGNLHLTGDAITASPGQPGNWTWNVSGTGIVEAVLEFGRGFDPYIGFDTLSFNCSQ